MGINNLWIDSSFKLRMFHKDALSDRTKQLLCNAWNDLTRYEMRLVMRHESIAKVFAQHVGDHKPFGLGSEKFHAYLADIEWVYIIERVGSLPGVCAFMAVTKDQQVLSLFVDPGYRGRSFGAYLIRNHLEIFGKSISLQCFKFNEVAISFYNKLGFKSSYRACRDDNNDLYDTLVYML